MTGARLFTPINTLARHLHDRRGKDMVAAVQAGHAAVKGLEPRMTAEVERSLERLSQLCAVFRKSGGEAAFPVHRVYASASAIAGLSAALGREGLGVAAASLCRLISVEREQRPEAIAVHIEAILMIRRDESLARPLLAELERLCPPDAPLMEVSTSIARPRPVLKGFSAL